MIGEIINGKYKIESAFSESRMYEVFTATELETSTTVVIKIMKTEMLANPGIVNGFSNEVKAFASLSHPLIAEILDVDMYEKRPYMVSTPFKGVELNKVLQESVLPFNDCLKTVQDLGTILQFASDHNVECRTIKLSNVLRSNDGKIKLLSFTQPRLKSIAGTNAKTENTGLNSDLYFLGITLYELLAGESPIRTRGGLNELWDMKLEKQLRIRHIDMTPQQICNIVEFIRKTISRDSSTKFKNHEDYLIALSQLSGKMRTQNNKTPKKQLCIASQVLDALNGVSNVLPSFSAPTMKGKNTAVALNQSQESNDNPVIGSADYKTIGNLALVTNNSDNFGETFNYPENTSKKSEKPTLRLVKPQSVSDKEEKALEWQEEGYSLKNPVIYMGILLAIMVALILFW